MPNDVVYPGEECPQCGENSLEKLIMDEDCEKVTCRSCGVVYTPKPREQA
jgi:uncharacterized Zn finger protein